MTLYIPTNNLIGEILKYRYKCHVDKYVTKHCLVVELDNKCHLYTDIIYYDLCDNKKTLVRLTNRELAILLKDRMCVFSNDRKTHIRFL